MKTNADGLRFLQRLHGEYMNYLLPEEYEQYGLVTDTPDAWEKAASSLINGHCRRSTLAVAQYVERRRIHPEKNLVRLTYLPLKELAPATNAIVAACARFSAAAMRYGELAQNEFAQDVARLWTAGPMDISRSVRIRIQHGPRRSHFANEPVGPDLQRS